MHDEMSAPMPSRQVIEVTVTPLLFCHFEPARRVVWCLTDGKQYAASQIARSVRLGPDTVEKAIAGLLSNGYVSFEERVLLGRTRRFYKFTPAWQEMVDRVIALLGITSVAASRIQLADYMDKTKVLKNVLTSATRYAIFVAAARATDGITIEDVADQLGLSPEQVSWQFRELVAAKILVGEATGLTSEPAEPHKKYLLSAFKMTEVSAALALLKSAVG